jgi:uncharacterized protein with ATP-grasp and redox domains
MAKGHKKSGLKGKGGSMDDKDKKARELQEAVSESVRVRDKHKDPQAARDRAKRNADLLYIIDNFGEDEALKYLRKWDVDANPEELKEQISALKRVREARQRKPPRSS